MTNGATISADRWSRIRAGEALLVVAVTAALLWLVGSFAPLEWRPAETEIVLDGTHYRAGPEEIRWLESFTARHFDAGQEAARALVAAEVDSRLDALFAEADANLPQFLDWYYSLSGEYSRLAMAALEAADLADAGFVAERAASMLLPEDAWAAQLAALERDAAERLGAHHAALRDTWRSAVAERLSAHRVPAPLVPDPGRPSLVLDDLYESVERELTALGTRASLSTGAAAIGAVAARGLARAAAVRSGRALASRAAARGASRIGTAAATGAAVCAPGGPVAAACAIVAGAGAWLATDWALLRLDERMHRAELERSLGDALTALRAEIDRELTAAFDASIASRYAAAEGEIRRTFVPAHAARSGEERE